MKIVTYDCEVFKYDWLVVFKELATGIYNCIWNDNEALRECIDNDTVYVGFNSKHYDQFIIKAICADFVPKEIKKLNDYIIKGGQGWNYPELANVYFKMNNCDIKDDMQKGLSLKAIEGHLGMNIQETEVDFNIDRSLTEQEKRRTEFYCRCDVDTAERVLKLRKNYIKNKIHIGKMAGIDEVKAMSMTNAKLTSAMLKATRKEHNDERDYVYPTNLLKEYIPQEVFEFFDDMADKSISDEVLFKRKLEILIGECPVTIGYGGIHGAIKNYFFEEHDNRIIRNQDVGSYYPHLMTICGYTSRNIPSVEVFENVLETRMQAKANGDKATANALKLVVNTTYGAMLNQYNDLYDPLMGRSVCITGQLFLLELAEHLHKELDDVKIVQLNTDGIMVEIGTNDVDVFNKICEEWQARTGFSLEEDSIVKIAQKDVNNYVEIQSNCQSKAKGGYLVKGVSSAGAFNINNSNRIVAKALTAYFVNGTSVEETILNCNDVSEFQIIAKAGNKYKEAYHLVNGEKIPIQKVNRVYATSDTRYGKLFKVKDETDSEAKIESLPIHCIIDNDNSLTIDDIDKQFYIDLAVKRKNDFEGIKEPKKIKNRRTNNMSTTATSMSENVYQKLIRAREEFLNGDVQKSGKNMHLSFKYFELDDIVPSATRIFSKVGLISVVNFTNDVATMSIINTDNPEEVISFVAPFDKIEPISSNEGKRATNEMQALGASITYMRRYLYMIALDICESDSIDSDSGFTSSTVPTASVPVVKEKKIPVTPEQRQEVKKELTAKNDNATSLQIKGLKSALNKLRTAQPDKEDFIAKIAVQTNGFTTITKSDCEAIINKVTTLLEGANGMA